MLMASEGRVVLGDGLGRPPVDLAGLGALVAQEHGGGLFLVEEGPLRPAAAHPLVGAAEVDLPAVGEPDDEHEEVLADRPAEPAADAEVLGAAGEAAVAGELAGVD